MCTCMCVIEKAQCDWVLCVYGWQTFLSDMENLFARNKKENERKQITKMWKTSFSSSCSVSKDAHAHAEKKRSWRRIAKFSI